MEKSEERIQQEIVIFYRNNYCLKHHKPRCVIFSVPNEFQQHLKKTGVMPGVSDLIVIHKTPYAVVAKLMFIEVKTPKGRQSKKQEGFQAQVEALGYEYRLIRSKEDFMGIFGITNESE